MPDRLGNAIKSAVTRAIVTDTRVGQRTFLQIDGLTGVQQMVELLLPPGYSARPVTGADVVRLQILGTADHVVALGGDMPGHAIQDLAPGEFGLTDGTQMVVFRTDHIQMVSPTKVRIEAPLLEVTGDIHDNCDAQTRTMAGMRSIYDAHHHTGVQTGTGTSGLPDGTM